MMHSVPNCLTTSQSFESSCFAPPSPPESSPPSSPFDFDLDLLPDEIVSPANLDFSLTVPVSSSICSNNNQEIVDNNTEDITDKSNYKSYNPLNNNSAFSPDCQVPNSPSSFSIDSGILSPTMFSPSSQEEQGNKNSGNKIDNINSPGQPIPQQQRSVPSASPLSMSPVSPHTYSPAAIRQQRRLSSTDSGKTSTSTASGKSFGGANIIPGLDFNLSESLQEFEKLQKKIEREQDGLESQAAASNVSGSEASRPITNHHQNASPSHTQISNVPISLGILSPYPPDALKSQGGGKLPSTLSLRSKLHTTIKSEPLLDSTSRKTLPNSDKPNPLLRQVLEDRTFEQKFGVKPMDFVMESSTLGSIEKLLGEAPTENTEALANVSNISNNPVISLAMDQVKKDILTTCEILSISPGN